MRGKAIGTWRLKDRVVELTPFESLAPDELPDPAERAALDAEAADVVRFLFDAADDAKPGPEAPGGKAERRRVAAAGRREVL